MDFEKKAICSIVGISVVTGIGALVYKHAKKEEKRSDKKKIALKAIGATAIAAGITLLVYNDTQKSKCEC